LGIIIARGGRALGVAVVLLGMPTHEKSLWEKNEEKRDQNTS